MQLNWPLGFFCKNLGKVVTKGGCRCEPLMKTEAAVSRFSKELEGLSFYRLSNNCSDPIGQLLNFKNCGKFEISGRTGRLKIVI